MGKKKAAGKAKAAASKADTIPVKPACVRIGPSSLPQHILKELAGYSNYQAYFPLLDTFIKDEEGGDRGRCEGKGRGKGDKGKGGKERNGSIEEITSLSTGLIGSFPYPEDTDHIFVKTIHILNPDDLLQGNYHFATDVMLPGLAIGWENVVDKLQCPENQAYVDTLTVSLLSQLREQGLSPHFVKYYGASVAKAATYRYNMSDTFQSYKNKKWFWKNQGIGSSTNPLFTLQVFSNIKERYLNEDEIKSFLLTPEQIELLSDDDDDEEEDSTSNKKQSDTVSELSEIINGYGETEDERYSIHSLNLEDENGSGSGPSSSTYGILRVSPSNHTLKSEDDYDPDDEEEHEFFAEFKDMPVMLVFMEKMEGVLDDLVTEIQTADDSAKWLAWFTQIIFALIQAQAYLEFTHNDLHGNNILYSNTDKEYLYYRAKDGGIWRIPTYGKIFHIIDFGRAILRVSGEQIISDDFFEGNDAANQYNFGSIRDQALPAIPPNPSFDLVRLTTSLYDALNPKKSLGPLRDLLQSWLIDTAGKSVLHTENGSERFPDFRLYKHIASSCKAAIPKEQLRKPVIEKAFKLPAGTTIPVGESLYPLFV